MPPAPRSTTALTGNSSANVLDGRAGNDILRGNGGNDIFSSRPRSPWWPTRISSATSRTPRATTISIRLDHNAFTALSATRPLSAAAFEDLALGAKDSSDRIIYDSARGDLFYDADGSGAGQAVKFAHLDNHATLDQRRFQRDLRSAWPAGTRR